MFETLKSMLSEEMNIDAELIKPEAELVADLGINSLELADLIFNCEEKFSVEIDEEDARSFRTVGDVVAYLEEKTANG
ncbi:MAG: acyl carrier protein [Clostridia bacterium]|nr:acyl carrier protein [Clostridia bacterium]